VPIGTAGTSRAGSVPAGTTAAAGAGGAVTGPGPRAEQVWRALWVRPGRALRLAVVVAVVGLVAGALATLARPTHYTSSTTLLIDDPYQLATAGQEGTVLKLDVLRIKYAGLVGTEAIAGPVAARLGLPVSAVLQSVVPEVPEESLLLRVQASWSTPAGARRLSTAVADELHAFVAREVAATGVAEHDRYSLSVVDPATPAVAVGPSVADVATDGLGLGVLGLLAGFVGVQLRRNLRPGRG